MGASALGIFLPVLGGWGLFFLCLLFSATGGLILATLLATALRRRGFGDDGSGHDGTVDDGQQFRPASPGRSRSVRWSRRGAGAPASVMVVAAAILAGLAAWLLARGNHNGVSETRRRGLTPAAREGSKEDSLSRQRQQESFTTRVRCITEMGMGVDVHGRDATKAAKRAVSMRSGHSSLGFFRMLGKTANDMFARRHDRRAQPRRGRYRGRC